MAFERNTTFGQVAVPFRTKAAGVESRAPCPEPSKLLKGKHSKIDRVESGAAVFCALKLMPQQQRAVELVVPPLQRGSQNKKNLCGYHLDSKSVLGFLLGCNKHEIKH
jgi:hypothetical protein